MTGETIAQPKFVLCIRNDGCDDLEPRKVYQVHEDPSAREEGYRKGLRRHHGMSTLTVEAIARARAVRVTDDDLVVDLTDGRTITVPLVWFPRLLHATPAPRGRWEFLGEGEGIHWPAIDEELSVAGLLRGTSAPPSPPRKRRRSNNSRQPP